MIATNGIHPPIDLSEELQRLRADVEQLGNTNELLSETVTELQLLTDETGWMRLSGQGDDIQFDRQQLRDRTRLCRQFYINNPIVLRSVTVKRFYVWGQDVNIVAKDDAINAVIQSFGDDLKNRVELTSHQARMLKEVDLEIDGNIFFVFFVNADNGHTRVRTIPFDEVEDVICNPQDSKEPWFYKRVWQERTFNEATGTYSDKQREDYYPDWGYFPNPKPAAIAGKPVHWDAPVYHVKVGGLSSWKFGLSEVHAAIDWAAAYRIHLERWATITKALSQFAMQVTDVKSKASALAGKAIMQTGLPNSGNNPAKLPGSTFIGIDGVKIEPIRTGGATTSPGDGRHLALMAYMVGGLPETFYGDASVGSLATAQSLDRPTELMMRDRQTFWADVLRNIYQFVLMKAVDSTNGPLRGIGRIATEADGSDGTDRIVWNEGVNGRIDIDFPPLISSDIAAQINAVVAAATLNGSADAGTIPRQTLSKMLLTRLSASDVDDILALMFDDEGNPLQDDTQDDTPPTIVTPTRLALPAPIPTAEAMMVEAVKELRAALAVALQGAV